MTTYITDRETLESTIEQVFQRVLENKLPAIIREATLKPYMTKTEIMEFTGWSSRTLQYLRDSKQIPFSQHGRKILYPTQEILDFLRDNKINPTLPTRKSSKMNNDEFEKAKDNILSKLK